MEVTEVPWKTLDRSEYADLPVTQLNHNAQDQRPADAAYLVTRDGRPLLRVQLWRSNAEVFTFREAGIWQGFLIVGWGHAYYVVDVDQQRVTRHDLACYFGHLFFESSVCLIASAENVVRLDSSGQPLWTSDRLGIDGVIITAADTNTVAGKGEWDPPGGWQPFRLNASTGQVLDPIDNH